MRDLSNHDTMPIASATRITQTARFTAAGALAAVVIGWWLLLGSAVIWLMPEPVASATPKPFAAVRGQTARIHQPGIPSWPIPVERVAFDEARLGFQESDEAAIMHAFAAYEWIEATHDQPVWIVTVDGDAIQIELLEGLYAGDRAWLKTRNLAPLH
ncbi:MAG TPA: hypothetical protein VFH48_27405 [Chloroflexota bacterium]|nr:hypothetical protein [Chloroflexota bacterium]